MLSWSSSFFFNLPWSEPSQVPADIFVCVGFRIKTQFVVSGVARAQLSIYEPEDKGESGAAELLGMMVTVIIT